MKKLLLLLAALSISLPALAVDRWWGLDVVDFRFSIKKAVSKNKAAFMVRSLLDPDKLPGMAGLTSLELENDTLKLKFKVFRAEGIDLTETLMNAHHWGVDLEFEKGAMSAEASRWITLSNIKSVELFKGIAWERRKAGKVTIKPATEKVYFCRLVTHGGRDFIIRSDGAREALRVAAAFASLTDLPVSHNKHLNESGFVLDDEFRVIESNGMGRVKGLPLFAIIKKVAGSKIVSGDNVAEMIQKLGEGSHKVEIVRPKSSKKKVIEITVK